LNRLSELSHKHLINNLIANMRKVKCQNNQQNDFLNSTLSKYLIIKMTKSY